MSLIIITKEIPDINATLLDERNIAKGSSRLIKYSELNINSVKSAVRNLKNLGYDIDATERGQTSGILVSRGFNDQIK